MPFCREAEGACGSPSIMGYSAGRSQCVRRPRTIARARTHTIYEITIQTIHKNTQEHTHTHTPASSPDPRRALPCRERARIPLYYASPWPLSPSQNCPSAAQAPRVCPAGAEVSVGMTSRGTVPHANRRDQRQKPHQPFRRTESPGMTALTAQRVQEEGEGMRSGVAAECRDAAEYGAWAVGAGRGGRKKVCARAPVVRAPF